MSEDNVPDFGWTFDIAQGVQGWQGLQHEWQALVDQDPTASMLHQPACHGAYLHHLCETPEQVVFVTARQAGQLRAVLPLEMSRRMVGMVMRDARLLTHEHMLLADMVASPAVARACWPDMLNWLKSHQSPYWDILNLEGLAEDSRMNQSLSEHRDERTLSVAIRTSAWLDCSGTVDQALADVQRAHRSNVRRLARRAASRAPLRFDVVSTPDRADEALAHFFAVEASGWKADVGTAIDHHPALRAFYTELTHASMARQACRIHLLWLGDEVIAAQFALIGGRQMNLMKIGYSERHRDLAPGHLIMHEAIEAVCADPMLDRLSFITNPSWAHLWKPHVMEVFSHRVFSPSLRGWSLFQMAQLKQGWRQTASSTNEGTVSSDNKGQAAPARTFAQTTL